MEQILSILVAKVKRGQGQPGEKPGHSTLRQPMSAMRFSMADATVGDLAPCRNVAMGFVWRNPGVGGWKQTWRLRLGASALIQARRRPPRWVSEGERKRMQPMDRRKRRRGRPRLSGVGTGPRVARAGCRRTQRNPSGGAPWRVCVSTRAMQRIPGALWQVCVCVSTRAMQRIPGGAAPGGGGCPGV
jgi:hypothetical protein